MITFNIINENIAGSIGEESFSVKYNKATYDKLIKAQNDYNKAESIEEAKNVLKDALPLVKKDIKEQIEEITPYLTYDPNTDSYHLKEDKKTSVIPLPTNFVEKVKYAIDKDLPVDPLVKFITRALRSPRVTDAKDVTVFLERACWYVFQTFVSPNLYKKYHEEEGLSEDVACQMARVPQTPITQEGLLSTKKVVDPYFERMRYKFVLDDNGNPKKVLKDPNAKAVDEDTGKVTWNNPEFAEDWIFWPTMMKDRGDDFYSGRPEEGGELGHIIQVGKEMALPDWKYVDTNDHHACVPGIHTGNYDYVSSWESDNNATLNCFVCPGDIGAIPYSDVRGVLRVLRLFPHSVKDRDIDNKNLYHSSEYAKVSDEIWKKRREEAINRFDGEVEQLKKSVEEDKQKYGW